ncbi:MAG TPA: hypothetical protein VGQ09_15335 [Chitinophagaceae bacterium]|nr:hypothetical protein [Chitinophagaceae bacterium]
MPFAFLILIRILFVASMVFIIGYVFGNFSKNVALTWITRFASILVIVLFIGANIFLFRVGAWHRGNLSGKYNCTWQRDTTINK